MTDNDQDWTGFWLADARVGTGTIGSNLGNCTSNTFYGFRGSAAGGTAQAYRIAPSATNNFIYGEIAEAVDYFADEEDGSGPNRVTDNTAPDRAKLGSAISIPTFSITATHRIGIERTFPAESCPALGIVRPDPGPRARFPPGAKRV